MSEQAERVNDRPTRVYLPWTPAEDRQLLQAYDQGKPLKDLATQHHRSLGAIKSRLLHLGKQPRNSIHTKASRLMP